MFEIKNQHYVVIWYTDTHIRYDITRHQTAINNSFTYGEALNASFSVHTGDTVDNNTDANMKLFSDLWDIVTGEKYLVAGNHDLILNGTWWENSINYTGWNTYYGTPPEWAFTKGSYLFIGLSWERLDQTATRDWLESILESNQNKCAVIFTHNYWYLDINSLEPKLDALLKAHSDRHFVVFSGHQRPTPSDYGMQYFSNANIEGILFNPQHYGSANETFFTRIDFYDTRIQLTVINPINQTIFSGQGAPYEYTLTLTK